MKLKGKTTLAKKQLEVLNWWEERLPTKCVNMLVSYSTPTGSKKERNQKRLGFMSQTILIQLTPQYRGKRKLLFHRAKLKHLLTYTPKGILCQPYQMQTIPTTMV